MTFAPLGDSALVLALEDAPSAPGPARARAVANALIEAPPSGVTEVLPAFSTVTVFYDPARIRDLDGLQAAVAAHVRRAAELPPPPDGPVTEIPVCYGGDAGPDLAALADRCGLSVDAVVALHAGALYVVEAVGFLPGFAYLGGLPEALHTPRRATPRPRVPAGSVGIGGTRTGVYPVESPGGWNLIGRTPLVLFDPDGTRPAVLRAGDRVRFRPVTATALDAWS